MLFLAHLQSVIIPIYLGIKSFNKFKQQKNHIFIPVGFFFFGLASFFEMIDHTQTDWIYVNHSTFCNWLFYSFLSLGLTSLSISVIQNKFNILVNLIFSFCSIFSYVFFGKTISLFFQVFISILLIINWQKFFNDWLFIFYPIFGIVFTTFFGIKLSSSGDQFWHILIGPSGSISVMTFYIVLQRATNKIKKKLL